MKSVAPLAVAAIVSGILIVGCVQTPQTGAPNPPANSYQIGSFDFQDSGSSQKVHGASVTAAVFQSAKVAPLVGRGFLPEEYSSNRQQVVLINQRF